MKKYLFNIFACIFVIFLLFIIFNNKKQINNSVVYIESISVDSVIKGSGFVYKIEDEKVYIITCNHVIEDSEDIYVYNQNKDKIKAKVLAHDEYTDIALIQINNEFNLKPVNLGNSDLVKINDDVYAIGTPVGIKNINTISNGSVLLKEKEVAFSTKQGISELKAIELSVSTQPGNSGGPLFNDQNEVIGMMILKEDNLKKISYALPINYFIKIINKMENNELLRPNLGAVMCNTTNTELLSKYGISTYNQFGIVLLELDEKGLLYNNEFQCGDIIQSFNNKVIENIQDLQNELLEIEYGKNVEISYYRNGKILQKEMYIK